MWPNNETIGLPSGLNTSPLSADGLISFLPGLNCGGTGGASTFGSGSAPSASCLLVVVPVVTALAQVLPQSSTSGPYRCTCEGINVQPITGLCLTQCECTDTLPDRFVEFSMKTLRAKCNATLSCPRRITATEFREKLSFLGITIDQGIYTPTGCDFFPPL